MVRVRQMASIKVLEICKRRFGVAPAGREGDYLLAAASPSSVGRLVPACRMALANC